MPQPVAQEQNIEMSLREHLLAAQAPLVSAQEHRPLAQYPPSSSDHHIDPAIAGTGLGMSAGDSGGSDEHMGEGRKGRRELSTSKRAAQNRAAQRAFRQRKEEYIKSLKDQVREYEALAENYKAVQAENYQLRDYIIGLQSRLLESQLDYPQPPSNIDLSQRNPHPNITIPAAIRNPEQSASPPAPHQQQLQREQQEQTVRQQQVPTAPMSGNSVERQLQAAAQAAGDQLHNGGKHTYGSPENVGSDGYAVKRQRNEETQTGATQGGLPQFPA